MMKTSTGISMLAAVGILGLGTWGYSSAQQTDSVKKQLASQVRMVQTLQSIQDNSVQASIDQLIEKQLEQVPESAHKLSSTKTSEVPDFSLKSGVDELWNIAVDDSTGAADRAQALTFAQQLWHAGSAEKLVKGSPEFVGTVRTSCDSPNHAEPAPDSVQDTLASAHAYLYAAQVIDARSPEPEGSVDEKRISDALAQAEKWEQNLSEATSCNFQVPAQQPAYDFDEAQAADSLKSLQNNVEMNVQAVWADSAVATDSPIFGESVNLSFGK